MSPSTRLVVDKVLTPMTEKRVFFIYEINWLNYPLLKILSLFGAIAYIKRPAQGKSLLKNSIVLI